MTETRWWLCPNGECEHGNILHDRDDFYEGVPTCCADGCQCGHAVTELEVAP